MVNREVNEAVNGGIVGMFLRVLFFPFHFVLRGLHKMIRWMVGGIYDSFSRRKEEAAYEDLLVGDYFHYDTNEIMDAVDHMDGYEFETFAAALLNKNGFEKIECTKGSGDQGVDIIAEKEDLVYAFQCKHFSSKLGNTPVQEIVAGRIFYHCHVGVVLTNSFFTESAQELAKANLILLWDRKRLAQLVEDGVKVG